MIALFNKITDLYKNKDLKTFNKNIFVRFIILSILGIIVPVLFIAVIVGSVYIVLFRQELLLVLAIAICLIFYIRKAKKINDSK